MEATGSDPRIAVSRTSVEIDVELLASAKATLGTVTTRDTIDAALRRVIRRAQLARAAQLIAEGGLDIVTPEELAVLRRPEH